MIGVIFEFGSDYVEVRVSGNALTFRSGGMESDISGLNLSKSGVIKEHPDLEGNPNWKDEAVKRFKQKLASFKTDDERMNYVIEELRGLGYKPKYKQKSGFRVEVIK